ncbi:MAG: hypothetical protein JXO44_13300, partial [Clostridia bacterium]|nr:hypothetical protein [Clostridia bacterium]
AKAHIARHNLIKAQLNDKINDIFSRKTTALDVAGLYNFLTEWLSKHIIDEDQNYKSALKDFHDI